LTFLIDSTLWVDFFRAKTPAAVKHQIIPFIDAAEAVLCEPVRFEILRASFRRERPRIEATFATLPLLADPPDLWESAAALGQKCVEARFIPPAIDLLIAQTALAHAAEVITFDSHFTEIARVSSLQVRLLRRAA
jgi:predicted nucleic acid-binding protein